MGVVKSISYNQNIKDDKIYAAGDNDGEDE